MVHSDPYTEGTTIALNWVKPVRPQTRRMQMNVKDREELCFHYQLFAITTKIKNFFYGHNKNQETGPSMYL